MGRYIIAKKQEYHWEIKVTKTDCTNPEGHRWDWIIGKKAESIRREHPKLTSYIIQCIHCGKVSCSM